MEHAPRLRSGRIVIWYNYKRIAFHFIPRIAVSTMKLTSKLYLLFLFSSMSLVLFVIVSTFYLTKNILTSEKYSDYGRLASSILSSIDILLNSELTAVKTLSARTAVAEIFLDPSSSRMQAISGYLSESKNINRNISDIYLIDTAGNVVLTTDKSDHSKSAAELPIRKEILEKVFFGEAAYSDVFLSSITGTPTMIFSAPVFSPEGRGVIGAVETRINWDTVLEILENADVTFAHLLNRNGIEIGSNDPDDHEDILREDYSLRPDYDGIFFPDHNPSAPRIIIAEDLHGGFQSVMAHVHSSGYADYKGNGWILVLEEPVDMMVGKINRNSLEIALFGIVFLLVFSLALFLFMKRHIVRPLDAFFEISKRIASGEKNLRLPDFGRDEIGSLAAAYNNLVDRFSDLNNSLESKVREKTSELEEELRLRDVQEKMLEDNKSATLNLLEDVSIEKRRSEALVSELNKFQLAVENAYEHIVITDQDGVILYANKAAEKVTGYARGEIIGNKPSFWGRQMPKEFYEQMWKTVKTDKKVFIGELKNRRKNGAIYDVDVRITPILDRDGIIEFFVAIERDITDQKKLEDARTSFISVASHQLRTPLTSIKWISELLLSGDVGEIPEKQKEFIEDLYVSSNRMISLVNGLLNIARIESTELRVKSESVDFREIYGEIIKELHSLVEEKNHSISLTAGDDVADIHTDSRLLYEILKNLLTNAIKYTPQKGIIRVNVEKKDEEILISVSDNGMGIPKSEQQKVFGKFFRGENVVKISTDGTGLGMYIVKNLTESLGGRVWFESEENKGTIFYLALPAAGPRVREGSKTLVSMN